eukprot:scaffold175051_cov27-Tisochrysis_lutea.AAC.1
MQAWLRAFHVIATAQSSLVTGPPPGFLHSGVSAYAQLISRRVVIRRVGRFFGARSRLGGVGQGGVLATCNRRRGGEDGAPMVSVMCVQVEKPQLTGTKVIAS